MKALLSIIAIAVMGTAMPLKAMAEDKDSTVVAKKFDAKHFAIGTASGLAIDLGLVQLLKAVDHEWRPDYSDDKSMPSRHAAVAWNLSTALSRELVPHNAIWAPVLQLGASAISQQRVMTRKHHADDIFIGAGLGIGTNILGNVIANAICGNPQKYPKRSDITPRQGFNITVTSSFTGAATIQLETLDDTPQPVYDKNGKPIPYAEMPVSITGYSTGLIISIPLEKKYYFDVKTGLSSYLINITRGNDDWYTTANAFDAALGLSMQKPFGKKYPATFDLGGYLGCRVWNSTVSDTRMSFLANIHFGFFWFVVPKLSAGFLYDLSFFQFKPNIYPQNAFNIGSGMALCSRYYF